MAAPLVFSVEDNDGDFALIELVLRERLHTVDIRRASDGEQALTLLHNQPRPDLVLLDINIPRMNGFDVLEFIKSQVSTCDAPVVMFTSSKDIRERRKALALGAQEFVTKPTSLDGMLAALNAICVKYLSGSIAVI